jgi:hypothetical protein
MESATKASIWCWCRVVNLPLYLTSLRTLLWTNLKMLPHLRLICPVSRTTGHGGLSPEHRQFLVLKVPPEVEFFFIVLKMLSRITNFTYHLWCNLSAHKMPMYVVISIKSRSPEVSTRTRAPEMVEPVSISNHDIPFKQLGHQLGELVAITTHPKVLCYP